MTTTTTNSTNNSSLYSDVIGKKCIIRCTNAGVFFGTVDAVEDGYAVKLSNVRKLWYWEGAAAVEELAVNGVKNPGNCKFTLVVSSMVVTEAVQIIPVTGKAADSLEAVKDWVA